MKIGTFLNPGDSNCPQNILGAIFRKRNKAQEKFSDEQKSPDQKFRVTSFKNVYNLTMQDAVV